MLYYTIAYDWMLFGHNLEDRLSKGEEIFFFCFYFLKYICDEDFSIKQDFNKRDSKSSSSNDDDEIKHPIFDMELAIGDPSIIASGSDSNENSRASKDGKDSQNKYSSPDIIWTNSPPKTEKFGKIRYIYFLIIYNTFMLKILASTLALNMIANQIRPIVIRR